MKFLKDRPVMAICCFVFLTVATVSATGYYAVRSMFDSRIDSVISSIEKLNDIAGKTLSVSQAVNRNSESLVIRSLLAGDLDAEEDEKPAAPVDAEEDEKPAAPVDIKVEKSGVKVKKAAASMQQATDVRSVVISRQNDLRRAFALNPFKVDRRLTSKAKTEAGLYASACSYVDGNLDPNVFFGKDQGDAVPMWAEAAAFFDMDSGSCIDGHDCSDWKRMMSSDAEKIGCGMAACFDSDSLVVVCLYSQSN